MSVKADIRWETEHRSRPRRERLAYLPSLAMGLLLAYPVLLPLALIVISSFRPGGFPLDPGFTLANYFNAYGDPGFPALVGATVLFALGSTAVALVLGTGLAWLVERSDLPGRDALRGLVLLPMATPLILLAIAWAMLLSPRNGAINQWLMQAFALDQAPFNIYTLPGMIFVQGLRWCRPPICFSAPPSPTWIRT